MLYVYIVMVEDAEDGAISAHRSPQGAGVEILSRYPGDATFEDGRPFEADRLEEALEQTGMARIVFEEIRARPDYVPPACPRLRVERHVLGV